jgi:hypothetical protein
MPALSASSARLALFLGLQAPHAAPAATAAAAQEAQQGEVPELMPSPLPDEPAPRPGELVGPVEALGQAIEDALEHVAEHIHPLAPEVAPPHSTQPAALAPDDATASVDARPAPPAKGFGNKLRSMFSEAVQRLKARQGSASTQAPPRPGRPPQPQAEPAADPAPAPAPAAPPAEPAAPATASEPGPAPSPPASEPAPAPQTQAELQRAPAGAQGFDTDTALTAETAQAFADAGFRFAVRYLSRQTPQAAHDLGTAEAQAILEAGLALMAVQHCAPSGWAPTEALGKQYGQAAVANAQQVGLPAGLCLWLDLEGAADGTAASDVIAYANAWFGAVAEAGFVPGVYVGAGCGLSAAELGSDLQCGLFWRSGSDSAPSVDGIGFCMVQTIDAGAAISGMAYDSDVVQADEQGKTPVWLVAAGARGG